MLDESKEVETLSPLRFMTMSLFFPVLFDFMIALRSTETHNITLKSLALFRPKLCDSLSTNPIVRFGNFYFYGVSVIESSI